MKASRTVRAQRADCRGSGGFASLVVAAACAAALVLTGSTAAATEGELDHTFGTGGTVVTPLGTGGAGAQDVLTRPGGTLVAAGWAVTGISFPFSINIDFAIVQYDSSGTRDAGFGSAGSVLTEFRGGNDQASALVRQPDGKLVAAGWAGTDSTSSDIEFAVARYNPDGSLDGTFGTGGKVTTNLTPAADFGYDVAIDAAGRIIVAGVAGLSAFGGGAGDFAVARYNSDGTPDATFGTSGVRIVDFAGSLSSEDIAFALALQSDGKIVAVGTAGRDTLGSFFQRAFGLARLNPDGSLDTSFGTGGRVVTRFTFENAEALGVAIAADGKIVVSGAKGSGAPRHGSGRDFALARYLPDGTLDPSFGDGGTTTVDFFGGGDEAADITIQPLDGKIVAGGTAQVSFGDVFALARFTSGGALDVGFGIGGKVSTSLVGGGSSRAEAVALQSDGKIVLAGVAAGERFGLARYLAAPPDITPPMLTVPGLVTVNATSPAGATVLFSASADDTVDPSPGLICVPPSGSTFAIGETVVSCTATDEAGNSSSATFTVIVIGAEGQLIGLLDRLAIELGVPGSSLVKKVEHALRELRQGRTTKACQHLSAFIDQVEDIGDRLPSGAELVQFAERIRVVLAC